MKKTLGLVLLAVNISYASNYYEIELLVNKEPYIEDIFSIQVLPKEKVNIIINRVNGKLIDESDIKAEWNWKRGKVSAERISTIEKEWIAPKRRGIYPMKIKIFWKDKIIVKTLNIIVLIPIDKHPKARYLNLMRKYNLKKFSEIEKKLRRDYSHHAIGKPSAVSPHLKYYLKLPFGILSDRYKEKIQLYEKYYLKLPVGIIEVTKANKNTNISSNFKLKDFLCKGDKKYPKYICLDMDLIKKLEAINEKLKDKKLDTLKIMSGYRTPWYNKKIKAAKYSRHIYGDAADIFIDKNNDGIMDDINKDGHIDIKDAEIILSIVNKIEENRLFPGGASAYSWDKKRSHGPFVHVDTRGYSVRW